MNKEIMVISLSSRYHVKKEERLHVMESVSQLYLELNYI